MRSTVHIEVLLELKLLAAVGVRAVPRLVIVVRQLMALKSAALDKFLATLW
jgi:hypothetical protein